MTPSMLLHCTHTIVSVLGINNQLLIITHSQNTSHLIKPGSQYDAGTYVASVKPGSQYDAGAYVASVASVTHEQSISNLVSVLL